MSQNDSLIRMNISIEMFIRIVRTVVIVVLPLLACKRKACDLSMQNYDKLIN